MTLRDKALRYESQHLEHLQLRAKIGQFPTEKSIQDIELEIRKIEAERRLDAVRRAPQTEAEERSRQEAVAAEARRERELAEEQQREQQRIADQRKAQVARDKQDSELSNRVRVLQNRVNRESNFLNHEFRESYAREHQDIILRKSASEWGREYDEIFANEELWSALQVRAPEVIHWLDARHEVVRLAEIESLKPKPPRAKPTPEEWRDRMTQRARTVAQDEAAMEFAAAESELEVQDVYDAKEQEIDRSELAPDQKERRKAIIRAMAERRLKRLKGEDSVPTTSQAPEGTPGPTVL